jgi:hypothetical protein
MTQKAALPTRNVGHRALKYTWEETRRLRTAKSKDDTFAIASDIVYEPILRRLSSNRRVSFICIL